MTVNVAVVGLGYWGPNLARAFSRVHGAELRMLCDLDRERLARLASVYPRVSVTTDYDQVLQDPRVDAVVLATPAGTHYELAAAALQAGKHVLVEKPLAQSAVEAAALVQLAQDKRRVLMVGHVFLYNAGVRKVKELLDAGALGRIFYVYAQRLNLGIIRRDVNALWNFAPHDISVINYWLGAVPERVYARGYAYVQPGIEDVVFLTMEYPGGVAANVHVSWLDPHKVRNITVVGSECMVEFDDMNPDGRVSIYEKRAVSRHLPASHGLMGNGVTTYTGSKIVPHIPFEEPLLAECRDFVDSILHGMQPLSDGTDGLKVVEVLEAASQSLRQGTAVVVGGQALPGL